MKNSQFTGLTLQETLKNINKEENRITTEEDFKFYQRF
jgi:hypothetical protein